MKYLLSSHGDLLQLILLFSEILRSVHVPFKFRYIRVRLADVLQEPSTDKKLFRCWMKSIRIIEPLATCSNNCI